MLFLIDAVVFLYWMNRQIDSIEVDFCNPTDVDVPKNGSSCVWKVYSTCQVPRGLFGKFRSEKDEKIIQKKQVNKSKG